MKLTNTARTSASIVRKILLIGICILIPFIIYAGTLPERPFTLFVLLNDDKEMGNYPQNVKVNETVKLYVYIENRGFRNINGTVKYYTGTNDTINITESGINSTLPPIETLNFTLDSGANVTLGPFNASFNKPFAENEYGIIAFELYIDGKEGPYFWDILVLKVNTTDSGG